MDHGHDRLLPARMWHPDHSGVLHERVLQEYLLDLDGRDILTTGFDHVFQAIDEQHLAIFIDDTQITGVMPAKSPEWAVACASCSTPT